LNVFLQSTESKGRAATVASPTMGHRGACPPPRLFFERSCTSDSRRFLQ